MWINMMYMNTNPVRVPTIVKKNAASFLSAHEFDLYIGNPYSAQFIPREANSLILTHSLSSDLPALLRAMPKKNGKILAFGAGSVIDPAKYIAKMTESTLVVIPTALSVNSFATHRSSFFDGQSKQSMDTIAPDTIVLDFEILRSAGILNTLGTIELAATTTALTDWLCAIEKEKAPQNTEINARCVRLIENAVDLLGDVKNIPNRLEQVFEGLLESGMITQSFGSGRPVSGSEHVISAYIENEIVGCAHGAGLWFGIQVASILQAQSDRDSEHTKMIARFLREDDTIRAYLQSEFKREVIEPIMIDVKPRIDKYTILDEVSRDQLQYAVREVCNGIFV
jgi:glycerol dehydrogenase-like iron-containing ADH family enzyme